MFDIYAAITDRLITEMESGIIPWCKPWISSGVCVSHVTGKPYSLLNQILLGRPGEYLTFNECRKEGGHVRKGERGSMVVFWKWIDKTDDDGQPVIGDDGKPEQVPFLRYYNVFHIDQCEGIKARFTQPTPDTTSKASPDERAESIIRGYVTKSGVTFRSIESSQAYYQPSSDTVVIPMISQFTHTAEYYSTAFHELTHSTGHHSRLNRITETAAFGSDSYSKEELVAEIGAAALVNICELETADSFRNSAAYLQNWLKALQNDKKLIVSAAGKAEKAVAMIIGE